METLILRNIDELNDYLASDLFRQRHETELYISEQHNKVKEWYMYGFCESCGKPSEFMLDWQYSDHILVNYRERLVCITCQLNNRQRYVLGCVNRLLQSQPIEDVYLYEQVTPFYHSFKKRFTNLNVIGSEYLGFDKKPGEVIQNIRHEDALNLSFNTNSLDIIISNDVFEHVPDIDLALQESYRVLRDHGQLIFTIPFYHNKQLTSKRAELINGQLNHIEPEQYHGNPIAASKGSLVFYDYGWDILDKCKSAGFKDAHLILYHSFFYGYLQLSFYFVASR